MGADRTHDGKMTEERMAGHKPKLTDEELSRVLSQAAAGKLNHAWYGQFGYGCVAGAALALGECEGWEVRNKEPRALKISNAVQPPDSGPLMSFDYGGSPTRVLRYLERKGVA